MVAAPAGISLRRAFWATATYFLLLGMAFGSWVTRIPAVQNRLGLEDGQLGVALLSMSIGAILAMPSTGWLIQRWGNVTVLRTAALALACMLPVLPLAPSMLGLMAALFVFGMSFGLFDVSMNTLAVALEERLHRPIMSTLHGMFSVGGLVGASVAGAMAGLGVDVRVHLLGVAVVSLAIAMLVGRALPEGGARDPDVPAFAVPSRALFALGMLSFFVLLGEGAIADWSAVYLENALGASSAVAALGFAAYALAMAGMRFGGDALIARVGPVLVVRIGCLIAAVGLGCAMLLGTVPAAIAGFAAVGLGLALAFPAALSAAGRTPGMAPGGAIGAVATAGYSGLLFGPPLIGFISDAVGLRAGLGLVAVLCLVSALLAGAMRR